MAGMSSGRNLKYQLLSTEKIRLPTLTGRGHAIQIDFSGKLHNKYITGEPFILIGNERYSKWPVVRICKSTETKEVINFLENFINVHGVP